MATKSSAPLPPGAAASALRAIQGDARLRVMRYLLDKGTSGRADLTRDTGLTTSTALVAIRELVDAGYVHTNVDGDRAGKRVEYSIDRKKVTADLFDLMSWLLT